MSLGQNLVFVRESQPTFCPIRKVLENHDWAKVTKFGQNFLPPNFFGWYAYAHIKKFIVYNGNVTS